jgi:aspartate oxidase
MEEYHPLASLAPRDVVARAIDREMKRTGDPYVLLDCSAIAPEEIARASPTSSARRGSGGSTCCASRSRWFPPRTTSAAAC